MKEKSWEMFSYSKKKIAAKVEKNLMAQLTKTMLDLFCSET